MKVPLRVLVLIAIILFTFNSSLYSQTGSIKGNVKEDGTGAALPYINVVLKGTSYGDATDKNGNFHIKGIDVGQYEISATGDRKSVV